MELHYKSNQFVLRIKHSAVILARGLLRPTLTESELLALTRAGIYSFPYYRFSRFSLENYPHIDIRYADISNLKELASVLRSFDCTGCLIIGVNLSGEHLEGARLSRATLTDSNLQGASLSGANLRKSNCQGVNFSYAVLHTVCAVETDFQGAQFFEAVSHGGNFHNANFSHASTRRFFVSSVESYYRERPVASYKGAIVTQRGGTAIKELQGRHSENKGSLRQAFSRMGAMIDKFHEELPTSTKVMIDILAVLLVLFVAAKIKQAGAEALHSPYHTQDVSEQEHISSSDDVPRIKKLSQSP